MSEDVSPGAFQLNYGMPWIYSTIGSAIFDFGLGALSDVALCVTINSYQAVSVLRPN